MTLVLQSSSLRWFKLKTDEEKRTAFFGGTKSDVLPLGDAAGDGTTEQGAEEVCKPDKKRDMRDLTERREQLD